MNLDELLNEEFRREAFTLYATRGKADVVAIGLTDTPSSFDIRRKESFVTRPPSPDS